MVYFKCRFSMECLPVTTQLKEHLILSGLLYLQLKSPSALSISAQVVFYFPPIHLFLPIPSHLFQPNWNKTGQRIPVILVKKNLEVNNLLFIHLNIEYTNKSKNYILNLNLFLIISVNVEKGVDNHLWISTSLPTWDDSWTKSEPKQQNKYNIKY